MFEDYINCSKHCKASKIVKKRLSWDPEQPLSGEGRPLLVLNYPTQVSVAMFFPYANIEAKYGKCLYLRFRISKIYKYQLHYFIKTKMVLPIYCSHYGNLEGTRGTLGQL